MHIIGCILTRIHNYIALQMCQRVVEELVYTNIEDELVDIR